MSTNPDDFKNPHGLGNKVARVLWSVVWTFLFRPSPKRLGRSWRCMLLRLFGAKLDKCWLHPSVKVWAPWKLEVGNDVFIDEGVWLYNAYGCKIDDRVIISANSTLCTASHDYSRMDYQLIGAPITIGSDVWITMQVFIMPGVNVGSGAVVGAQSVITRDVEPWTIIAGNPAKFVKKRILKDTAVS